ncbi:MAG: type II toxin-antitoxin system VapC family toxin [Verrucomicrobia bacterium]|nr:type II toxin-antitoxin system VapC family toxin [Verrucomicrobiota bacterium]
MGLIVDSNFVICMEREARQLLRGPAVAFLEEHAGERFFMPFTVAGELACGQSMADQRKWRRLCKPFVLLPWTPEVLWQYGEIYRYLQANGMLIGTNDLWIAATALVHGMPLVTHNLKDFRRIPGLAVLPY